MKFDYAKLKGKIREICETQDRFAEMMGICQATMSAKINNKSEFTQTEILRAVEILHLSHDEIPLIFLSPAVQKTELKTGKKEET